LLPPPAAAAADEVLAAGPDPTAVVIGRDVETGHLVALSADALSRSAYVPGSTGVGKSELLRQMFRQFMEHRDGVGLLDAHRSLSEAALADVPACRRDDVIFWDPTDDGRPFGLNPFYCPDPGQIDTKADHFVGALASIRDFAESFQTAPVMKNVLYHLAIALLANQGHTIVEAPPFLTSRAYRQRFYVGLDAAGYGHVRRFWEDFDAKRDGRQDELVASSKNKLERFTTFRRMRRIFGQPVPTLDLRRVIEQQLILIVPLCSADLGDDMAAFLGAFVVQELLHAGLTRTVPPVGRPPLFHLVADEFQRYMTTAFPRLQAEARKFGLDTVVAHQYRAQLDADTRGATLNVGNQLIFRVIGPDAAELAEGLALVQPQREVVGQQPRLVPALDPLRFLEQHGHGHPEIQRLTTLGLICALDGHQALLSALHSHATALNPHSVGHVGLFSHRHRDPETEVQRLRHLMTQYLFSRMTGGDDQEAVDELRAALDEEVIADVETLGTLLHEHPLWVSGGAYDPILAPPRLYTDLRAEVADALANLPNRTARCRILVDGTPREYTITTLDNPEPSEEQRRWALLIKQHSRERHGRDGREVERAIEERLDVPDPADQAAWAAAPAASAEPEDFSEYDEVAPSGGLPTGAAG
jgi:hypothetical protein